MTAVLTDTSAQLLARFGKGRHGDRPTRLPAMSRNDLPALARELGFTRGAEIGVWKGAYSAAFCAASPALHMLCVDPWVSYPAWQDTKNTMEPAAQAQFMADAYLEACDRLAPLNARIVRQFSVDAAAAVPDGSLDFVFLDGNHVYAAVLEDLTAWAPKVQQHGLVCGHDFRVFPNKPTIHVIEAVQDYTQAHAIDPWFVLAADRTPSFLWIAR